MASLIAMTKSEYRAKVIARIQKITIQKHGKLANANLPEWDKLYFEIDLNKRMGRTVGQSAKALYSKYKP